MGDSRQGTRIPGYSDVHGMALVGGRLCLDFSNTLSGRELSQPHERLLDYEDLVAWCQRSEIFGQREAERLLAAARERPDLAEAALDRARRLRAAIYRIFAAEAAGETPDKDEIAELNEVLGDCLARRRIKLEPSGCCWSWADQPEDLGWMLWPIAYSAAELLTSSELDRVKECGSEDCHWLFLDSSRNRSRRWCTMDDCGNRAKARRHYRRQRVATSDQSQHLSS